MDAFVCIHIVGEAHESIKLKCILLIHLNISLLQILPIISL